MQDTNKEQDQKINLLYNNMAELKKDIAFIREGICDIKANYVRKETFEGQRNLTNDRIGKIEDSLKWAFRLSVTTLVGLIINLVILMTR